MTRRLLYLTIGLLISCTQQSKEALIEETSKTTETTAPKNDTSSVDSDSGDDCVFNDDYKGLTTDWLDELHISDFVWSDELKQALVPVGRDTVFVSSGGCTHFGYLVELKLTNDDHLLTDSAYWISKALDLAIEYQMDHYELMIEEGKIRRADGGPTSTWYEIDDNNPEDNLIYNGIEITLDGQSRRISISQYFN